MKTILKLVLLLSFIFPGTYAYGYCGSEPDVVDYSSLQAWKRWCSDCGGRYTGNDATTISNNGGCHIDNSKSNSGYNNNNYDYEAERIRKQQEEAKRKQEEAAKQQQFIKDRNDAAATLKGPVGTDTLKEDLKGDNIVDTGIKDMKSDTNTRDLGGEESAWKQLYCAADISNAAFVALDNMNINIDEYKYLSAEAMKALNGDPIGVQCPAKTPPMPGSKQKKYDMIKMTEQYKKLIQKTDKLVDIYVAIGKEIDKLKKDTQAATTKIEELKKEPEGETQDKAAERKRALDEAIAAKKEAEKQLKQQEQKQTQAEKEIDRLGNISKKVENDPDSASDLLAQVDEPVKKK